MRAASAPNPLSCKPSPPVNVSLQPIGPGATAAWRLQIQAAVPAPNVTVTLGATCTSTVCHVPLTTIATLLLVGRVGDALGIIISGPCAKVKSPTSIADVEAQIAGQIDIPIPPGGLAAVELRGREGTCDEIPAYRDAIFYGAAVVDPSNSELDIPVRYNVSCGQTKAYTIQPLDLPTLVKTKACTQPMAGQVFEVAHPGVQQVDEARLDRDGLPGVPQFLL